MSPLTNEVTHRPRRWPRWRPRHLFPRSSYRAHNFERYTKARTSRYPGNPVMNGVLPFIRTLHAAGSLVEQSRTTKYPDFKQRQIGHDNTDRDTYMHRGGMDEAQKPG